MSSLEYCQFLLSSQINYTLTYFADHSAGYTHDMINRYLGRADLKPSMLWEHVKDDIQQHESGYVIFDDTVLDKNHSFKIESVRRQWSGNAGRIIKGIGVITCVYVNPQVNRFWIIDYRVYNPEVDGKGKPDHVSEMLTNVIEHKRLSFSTVLMDSWYASRALMLQIHKAEKLFYCPLKPNRLVSDNAETKKKQSVSSLGWTPEEQQHGKRVHVKDFPKDFYLTLFRLELSTERTEYVVTNASTHPTAQDAQKECAVRWKVEQVHRELKQVTGIERCQCRKQSIQRNHIACAMLVWTRLNQLAHKAGSTMYQLKRSLLDDYIKQELRSPRIAMA
jgi:hypothetical protein